MPVSIWDLDLSRSQVGFPLSRSAYHAGSIEARERHAGVLLKRERLSPGGRLNAEGSRIALFGKDPIFDEPAHAE